MVTINRYIKALLHPAGGHQGSHKTHQAGNQKRQQISLLFLWMESTNYLWIPLIDCVMQNAFPCHDVKERQLHRKLNFLE